MIEDQIICETISSSGKLSLDNGSITTDGAGRITVGTLTASLVSGGQSATAPATATSGTISSATRVSRVAPAGAITAVILATAPNNLNGCELTVVNEAAAANTITFDVQANSHVADGASTVIAGLTAARFVWDSITSLWYHCK